MMVSLSLRPTGSAGCPATSSLPLVISLNGPPQARTRRWQAIRGTQAGQAPAASPPSANDSPIVIEETQAAAGGA
jgi:hypothetical protein